MKRILFACFLLTATCTGSFQHAQAQTVSVTTFTAKVSLLDSFISVGDMTNANATWNDVHSMMLAELGVTKSNIASATSTAARTAAQSVNDNQYTIYHQVWGLKSSLAANRTSLHTALLNFAATF